MKKILKILGVLVAVLLVAAFVAWYQFNSFMEANKPDPACFASDKIRVEIGGEKFAFPRKKGLRYRKGYEALVHSLSGADVIDSRGEGYHGSASSSKACQKPNDPIWKIKYINLDVIPIDCSDSIDCTKKTIHPDIMSVSDSNGYLETRLPTNKEELLKRCRRPKDDNQIWFHCNYIFTDKNLHFYIKFDGEVYPPGQIEETKELLLNTIRKHRIK